MKQGNLSEITFLHVLGCVMILLCHFFQDAGPRYGLYSELFLAGLSLFFVVSGYLAGLKESHNLAWLSRRITRIIVPYYVVILLALIIYFVFKREEFSISSTLHLLTFTQGTNYIYWPYEGYMASCGFGHLWFITVMLLCIIITPLLKFVTRNQGLTPTLLILAVMILIIQPMMIYVGLQLSYLISYIVGYRFAKIEVTSKEKLSVVFWCSFVFLIFASVLRLMGRVYIDGTDLYDRYIALLSQSSMGIFLFISVFYFKRKLAILDKLYSSKPILWLATYTYEIYLLHYFFLKSPWHFSKYFENRVMADLLVVLCSVIGAIIINRSVAYIVKR